MWEELVQKKHEWIGGKLIDYGDRLDRIIAGNNPGETVLKDIVLTEDSITFVGEEFQCGGSRANVGIVGEGISEFPIPDNGMAFRGFAGHEFHITKPGG